MAAGMCIQADSAANIAQSVGVAAFYEGFAKWQNPYSHPEFRGAWADGWQKAKEEFDAA
jgi:ribosome modulation factor